MDVTATTSSAPYGAVRGATFLVIALGGLAAGVLDIGVAIAQTLQRGAPLA